MNMGASIPIVAMVRVSLTGCFLRIRSHTIPSVMVRQCECHHAHSSQKETANWLLHGQLLPQFVLITTLKV